jgi:hypothetical protein
MVSTAYKEGDNKDKAIADLATIAFFYLLRVGEYTRPRSNATNATRTRQFRVCDVGFFKDGRQLTRHTTSLAELCTADQCTLKISNQKNGRMGETITHECASHPLHCPVKATARRVHHILQNGGTEGSLISDFCTEDGEWRNITPSHMRAGLRACVLTLKLHEQGIDPDLIGVHSLRAGGAMALKLQGVADTTIKKQGRWTSMTFLQYIHNQIAHLSKGLSTKMNTNLTFQNIANIERNRL